MTKKENPEKNNLIETAILKQENGRLHKSDASNAIRHISQGLLYQGFIEILQYLKNKVKKTSLIQHTIKYYINFL